MLESFGFTAALRAGTGGQAFPQVLRRRRAGVRRRAAANAGAAARQCVFDHWEVVKGSPFEEGSKSRELVLSIRKRKSLSPDDDTPPLDRFYDKL